jgi:hypothetical protein
MRLSLICVKNAVKELKHFRCDFACCSNVDTDQRLSEYPPDLLPATPLLALSPLLTERSGLSCLL